MKSENNLRRLYRDTWSAYFKDIDSDNAEMFGSVISVLELVLEINDECSRVLYRDKIKFTGY